MVGLLMISIDIKYASSDLFFKKQFPNYNLNEKVTPYIALVNPGNDKDISLFKRALT